MDPVSRTLFVDEYVVYGPRQSYVIFGRVCGVWTPSVVRYLWVSLWCMDPVNRTLFVGEYVVYGPRQSYVICG